MTICSVPGLRNRSGFCLSTCCYAIERPIYDHEINVVGEENIFFRLDRPYIKAKPESAGACSLLDEDNLECTLSENRPRNCKSYDCRRMNDFQDKYQNVRHYRERNGLGT